MYNCLNRKLIVKNINTLLKPKKHILKLIVTPTGNGYYTTFYLTIFILTFNISQY